jgi:hypothetical protein
VSDRWTHGTGASDTEWANAGGMLEDRAGQGGDGVRMRLVHRRGLVAGGGQPETGVAARPGVVSAEQ